MLINHRFSPLLNFSLIPCQRRRRRVTPQSVPRFVISSRGGSLELVPVGGVPPKSSRSHSIFLLPLSCRHFGGLWRSLNALSRSISDAGPSDVSGCLVPSTRPVHPLPSSLDIDSLISSSCFAPRPGNTFPCVSYDLLNKQPFKTFSLDSR